MKAVTSLQHTPPAKEKKSRVRPPIWKVSDQAWQMIQAILDIHYPLKRKGQTRTALRSVLDGIIFRLRSGCQWNQIPAEFGDDSTIHRHFQKMCEIGIFERLWASLIQHCDELGQVDWEWQSVDCAMGKARSGGELIGPNPTDRAKKGVKRSVQVEADGGPISVVVAGANVHDCKLLADTLEVIVVDRPKTRQHLCLDKGYDNPTGHKAVAATTYIPHIRRIGEEKLDTAGQKTNPARRWVVERTLAWLSKCRGLLVRYDKKALNFLGLMQLACALIWVRRWERSLA
ncbi:MAG: IS5 family transposase [Candidatus Sericytochromatia bacterium]|nr:IS5 family transposase [Candidatus Sericytochromatia bacterium]